MIRLSLSFLFICLAAASAEPIALFNGKDLSNWTIDIPEVGNASPDQTFFVKDGLMVTSGAPLGHITTKESYSNYTLRIEYRFPKEPGNSGCMIHASDERFLHGKFPRSIEVQMMSGSAGDLIPIGENIIGHNKVDTPDFVGARKNRGVRKMVAKAEKPPGEWNEMVIHCQADSIVVLVNGQLVNVGTSSSVTEGKIAFQSEGAAVEWRKIELTPIPAQKKKAEKK